MLVEAMVALGALVVGFLGILALLNQSLGVNRVVADNYAATYLAAEGIEVVKNIIDANVLSGRPWNQGFADGDYEVAYASAALAPSANRLLRFDPATGRYSYEAPASSRETPFRRRIQIRLVGADEMQVNSIVSWQSRGGSFNVNLENHFMNWRP